MTMDHLTFIINIIILTSYTSCSRILVKPVVSNNMSETYYLTGTSDSVQTQDRPQPPQLSPVFQTLHWPYRVVPLRYWQSDNRTSTAVLPHLRAAQKGNLARPHSRSPQALRKPEGPAMHCHLHRGDWSFHLTNEKKKKQHAKCLTGIDILLKEG